MRKIRLEAEPEYSYKCEFRIIDVTEEREKKRGAITVDYGMPEINQLKDQNMSYDDAMDHYETRIYNLVKVLISDDWECMSGMDEAKQIISKYIKEHFHG